MINDNYLCVQRVNFWQQNRTTVKTDLKSILISIFDSVYTQIIIIYVLCIETRMQRVSNISGVVNNWNTGNSHIYFVVLMLK